MTALSIFAFKTCLKFMPVLEPPNGNVRVMTFVNPNGHRRCQIDTKGSSVYENFKVTLGYDCLKSPQIDMMIMKALGFPFEHNRLCRDLYINVMMENVEPGAFSTGWISGYAIPASARPTTASVRSPASHPRLAEPLTQPSTPHPFLSSCPIYLALLTA
ncbi:unnamed protein product [Arctia plantaginis]|nr:unnamed protein product [Arctia plantaginis]